MKMNVFDWLYLHLYIRRLPNYFNFIKRQLRDCTNVLELGCANNSPLQYFPKQYYSCAVDIFSPYLKKSRQKSIHNSYVQADLMQLGIRPKSFDCVIALGVLEHLEKPEGMQLIKEMEAIAKKKIILNMPNGFLWQGSMDGNLLQMHKSGWRCEELEILGYRAFGFFGLKILRKEYGKLRFRPRILWFVLSELSQLFTFKMPRYAAEIVYIKRI